MPRATELASELAQVPWIRSCLRDPVAEPEVEDLGVLQIGASSWPARVLRVRHGEREAAVAVYVMGGAERASCGKVPVAAG